MGPFKRRYFRNPYEFVASCASIVGRLDALPGYLRAGAWPGLPPAALARRHLGERLPLLPLSPQQYRVALGHFLRGGENTVVRRDHRQPGGRASRCCSTPCTGPSRTGEPIRRPGRAWWPAMARERSACSNWCCASFASATCSGAPGISCCSSSRAVAGT